MTKMITVVLLLGVACSRKQDSAPSEPSRPTPPSPMATAPAASFKGGTLPERLGQEANTRPAAALRSEDVFAAIVKSGVQIKERRQYLASNVGAAYCQGADTLNDVSLTVCEFESDALATQGQQQQASVIAVPNREILVHHATTLSVVQNPKGERSQKAATAASAAFQKL